MSTNAMIYAKQKDNSVKGVYLHWDGYPGWAGDMLLNNYTDDEKVQKLISLGALSVLGRNPEPSELVKRFGFDATSFPTAGRMGSYLPEEWCNMTDAEREKLMNDHSKYDGTVAYARDRKEPLEFDEYPTVADFKKTSACQAFEYYWDGKEWYMRTNKVFRKLTQNTCDKDRS
jgi:hypothetical protein